MGLLKRAEEYIQRDYLKRMQEHLEKYESPNLDIEETFERIAEGKRRYNERLARIFGVDFA